LGQSSREGQECRAHVYQNLLKEQIPTVVLPESAGTVRVIAGEYGGRKGPAKPTKTPNTPKTPILEISGLTNMKDNYLIY